ncbi:MAG: carboxypeptidase regulatory-like domain-containing protein [Gemmatimonadota bacterium]|nr:carboxypeptidase regulatory-like domain-containing protein [Gemmatimonadota bacterium]
MCTTVASAQRLPATGAMPPGNQPGRIRGVVFDSLLMKPIAHATVTLLDLSLDAIADDRGRFAFNSVPAGEHTIVFSTPEIDSLGFGTLGRSVVLSSGEVALVTVATPSIATLWQRRCGTDNRVSTDSGIVWGTIRDAASGGEANNAIAMFRWFELQPQRIKRLSVADSRREVKAASNGLYFACGLPTDVAIATVAAAGVSASGTIEYAIGERRLHHLDLFVSPDMVIPDSVKVRSAADSATWLRARGTATVKGTVIDMHGRLQTSALITVQNADTAVRSNKAGEFVIGGLPAGTQLLQAKQVGSGPVTMVVNLRSGVVTEVTLQLTDVNTLSVFNVRTQNVIGSDRREFEQRRKMGFGHVLEEKQLANRYDVASALRQLPGLQVNNIGFDVAISMRGMFSARCAPSIFLDGIPTDIVVLQQRPPADFRAIEVFDAATAPAQYQRQNTCGTLLFWSKQARW